MTGPSAEAGPGPDTASRRPEVPAAGLPAIRVVSGSPCQAHACTACCHDTEMLLTKDDVHRLLGAGADPRGWTRADDGYLQLTLREAPPLPGMQGRACWFLGRDGRCMVYDARPEGCRLYPAVYDGAVVLDDEECPHTEGFAVDRGTEAAVVGLVARLNDERVDDKQAGDGTPDGAF